MIDRIAPNLVRGEDYIERIAGHIADFTLAALRQQYHQPTSNKRPLPPRRPHSHDCSQSHGYRVQGRLQGRFPRRHRTPPAKRGSARPRRPSPRPAAAPAPPEPPAKKTSPLRRSAARGRQQPPLPGGRRPRRADHHRVADLQCLDARVDRRRLQPPATSTTSPRASPARCWRCASTTTRW